MELSSKEKRPQIFRTAWLVQYAPVTVITGNQANNFNGGTGANWTNLQNNTIRLLEIGIGEAQVNAVAPPASVGNWPVRNFYATLTINYQGQNISFPYGPVIGSPNLFLNNWQPFVKFPTGILIDDIFFPNFIAEFDSAITAVSAVSVRWYILFSLVQEDDKSTLLNFIDPRPGYITEHPQNLHE